MPVPDEFKLCEDFGHCEFCDKGFQDSFFVTVIFDNDKEGKENEKRRFEMCKDCREKCRIDKEYEKYATEKVFKLKLGRRVKVNVYDQDL